MSFSWKTSTNQTPGASRITNIQKYIIDLQPTDRSAIDNFYDTRTKIIQTATPTLLSSQQWISSLFIASAISATEDYFREVCSFCIAMCPKSKAIASEKNIHLGSAIWNSTSFFSRGCFEHLSFASQETIKKCSKEYLGYEISKQSNTFAALEEYDKLCELRHGIVHSNCRLPGKNAIKLGLQNNRNTLVKIEPGLTEIQESVAICSALVESYNQELFQEICKRWAKDWRSNPGWDSTQEHALFKEIYRGFGSEINKPHNYTWRKVMNSVRKEFGI